jgi:adenylosuccinate lyase
MSLTAISALDGRYARSTRALAPYFSEFALIRFRALVEVEWLKTLAAEPAVPEVRAFAPEEIGFLDGLIAALDEGEAALVKEIERTTNHDVKAVEYYLKRKLEGTSLADAREWLHFSCTSEDINNLSHALMLKGGMTEVFLPRAEALVAGVAELAAATVETPMLARTHGQPASPTTLGKELAVFVSRWRRQLRGLWASEYLGKFNGAVGNFNAHASAYPDAPWPAIAERFVTGLGLTYNPLTTQIESHDYMAELFHGLARFNNVLLDFDRDVWSYISLGYFRQRTVAGEVGSSTMPHKVNPIDFENSEANVGLANALLEHLAGKLAVSRLQRDLSDSSAIRSMGAGVAHSLLAVEAATRGLKKLTVGHAALEADLNAAWETLAEPIQTVMRKAGMENSYERLKALTRGATITEGDIRAFVSELDLPDDDRARLLALTPATYIGLATELARAALAEGATQPE